MARLALLLFSAALLVGLAAAVNDVLIKNNKLFVADQQFIIKGMSYNPAPTTFYSATDSLGGLCSAEQTPANGYISACYDSDFWDGYNYPNRAPTVPPVSGWFSPIWQRDLANIAAIGVNTLRIYNANPSNYLASQRYMGQYNISAPGKDHRPFFDACEQNGLKLLWPFYADAQSLMTISDDAMEFFLRATIEEVGNHSALLMYSMGNELNYVNNSDHATWVYILGRLVGFINYARNYQLQYWGRAIPITTVTDDNNLYYDWLVGYLPVDVYTANAGYRSDPSTNRFNFYDLWTGNSAQNFSGFYNLSCRYQVPLLIGEINPVGYANPPVGAYYPSGFPNLWQDLLNHVPQGTIGGFFFEWNDEVWKASGGQDQLGIHSVSVYCDSTGCSNQTNVFLADTLTQKGWEFQAVCCGLTNSSTPSANNQPYNFNSDPFTLIGYTPQAYSSATQDCPTNYFNGNIPARSGYTVQQTVSPTTTAATGSVSPTTAATTGSLSPTTATTGSPSPTIATTGSLSPTTATTGSLSPTTATTGSPSPTTATTGSPSPTTGSPSPTTPAPRTTSPSPFIGSPATTGSTSDASALVSCLSVTALALLSCLFLL